MSNNPPVCQRCGDEYTMDVGEEPTPHCDACAHLEVDSLRRDLAVTRAALAQCARVLGEARRCLDGSYGSEEAASDTIEDIDAALAHMDVERAVRVEAGA